MSETITNSPMLETLSVAEDLDATAFDAIFSDSTIAVACNEEATRD